MAEPIRPKDLPSGTPVAGSDLIFDSGTQVLKTKPLDIVNAGAPLASQAEAEAGVDNAKRMTPLRAKQAIDAQLKDPLASSLSGASLVAFKQDSSGAVDRTVMAKLQERVSVFDYGVVGDGVADDTVALQLADDRATAIGAALWFPKRQGGANVVILITGEGVVRGGCAWVGEDAMSVGVKSVAQSVTGGTGMVEMFSKNDVITEGLTFDITGLTSASPATGALFLFGCKRNIVRKNRFIGIGTYGIGVGLVAGADDNLVTENYFDCPVPDNMYNQAVNISNAGGASSRNRVTSNIFKGTGLYSDGPRTIVNDNIGFGGNLFGSYCCFGPHPDQIGCQANGNNFADSGLGADVNATYVSGIENWCSYAIITNNWCSNNGGHGISSGGSATIITGNTCLNNGQTVGHGNGIALYRVSPPLNLMLNDPSNSIVANNMLVDTQVTPTQLYGYSEYSTDGVDVFGVYVETNICVGNLTAPYLFDSHFLASSRRGRQATAKKAVTPGSVAAGGGVTGFITVAGARVGDAVRLGYSQDLQSAILTGHVDTTNSVFYAFRNSTASPIALASGTISVIAEEILA